MFKLLMRKLNAMLQILMVLKTLNNPPKQMQTIPAHHSWTEENLLNIGDYAYPFTLYQHCLPCNEWMNDDPISTPCSIFPETGPRRKNEVKDNFDWLLPRTKSADIKDTVMAYESSYQFGTGFSSLDRMVSNKICATPLRFMRFINVS